MKNSAAAQHPASDANTTENLADYWILRLLVEMGGADTFINRQGVQNKELVKRLGLNAWATGKKGKFRKNELMQALEARYVEARERIDAFKLPGVLGKNCLALQQLLKFEPEGVELLGLAAMLRMDYDLAEALDRLPHRVQANRLRVFARLLDINECVVSDLSRRDAPLMPVGLLMLDACGHYGTT